MKSVTEKYAEWRETANIPKPPEVILSGSMSRFESDYFDTSPNTHVIRKAYRRIKDSSGKHFKA